MKNLFIFVTGAAVGSLVTWKVLEKYYKDIADEEIESVKETFKNKENELIKDKISKNVEYIDSDSKKEYTNITITNDYIQESTVNVDPTESSMVEIIDPTEYGEMDNYDTKSWLYCADEVLLDENDEKVEDPFKFIGDGLTHFGEYERDSVYVRNNANQTDYEILLSEKESSEI